MLSHLLMQETEIHKTVTIGTHQKKRKEVDKGVTSMEDALAAVNAETSSRKAFEFALCKLNTFCTASK